MNEFEKLYKVEDIAKMTSLTSRTIRNYLKDGILKGKKIGGQWRFTMENIKQLLDNSNFTKEIKDNKKQQILDFINGVNTDIHGKIQICTIVDYYCNNQKESKEICDKLISVINNKDNVFTNAKFGYEFIEKANKARFTLFGTPEFIIKTLELLK
jgi:DNA-binding transcriptional MerR regulator